MRSDMQPALMDDPNKVFNNFWGVRGRAGFCFFPRRVPTFFIFHVRRFFFFGTLGSPPFAF